MCNRTLWLVKIMVFVIPSLHKGKTHIFVLHRSAAPPSLQDIILQNIIILLYYDGGNVMRKMTIEVVTSDT